MTMLAYLYNLVIRILKYYILHPTYRIYQTFPTVQFLAHPTPPPIPIVLAVAASPTHSFSKTVQSSITLIVGLGVQGDCHLGKTVQHRSRLGIRPPPPNLRQVHLLQSEIFQDFQESGADHADDSVEPGQLGENVTTVGINLLGLGRDTELRFVDEESKKDIDGGEEDVAVVCIKGLRNPCPQIDQFRNGLREKCIARDHEGEIVGRKAGVMGVVVHGGIVRPGMTIVVEPPEIFMPLECVWNSGVMHVPQLVYSHRCEVDEVFWNARLDFHDEAEVVRLLLSRKWDDPKASMTLYRLRSIKILERWFF